MAAIFIFVAMFIIGATIVLLLKRAGEPDSVNQARNDAQQAKKQRKAYRPTAEPEAPTYKHGEFVDGRFFSGEGTRTEFADGSAVVRQADGRVEYKSGADRGWWVGFTRSPDGWERPSDEALDTQRRREARRTNQEGERTKET